MKNWPVFGFLFFLTTSSASAQQEWSTARSSWPPPQPPVSATKVVGTEVLPKSDRTASVEVAEPHAVVPETEPEDDPLHRYHFVHNERIHRLRQRAWRNVFADPVHLFDYWYTSRKGITLLHFLRGRLRVGFETNRVQVPQEARNYFGPTRALDVCQVFPSYEGGICRPLYFHEGERRYSLTLRLNFGR